MNIFSCPDIVNRGVVQTIQVGLLSPLKLATGFNGSRVKLLLYGGGYYRSDFASRLTPYIISDLRTLATVRNGDRYDTT